MDSTQEKPDQGSDPVMEQDTAVDHRSDADTGLPTGGDGDGDLNVGQPTTTLAPGHKNSETQAAFTEQPKTHMSLDEVVLDEDIYGRANVDRPTVEKYFEHLLKGDIFPPVVIEKGTNRLLDGWHRFLAKRKLAEHYYRLIKASSKDPFVRIPQSEITTIECEYHEVSPGISPRVYGFRFNLKHGKPATDADYRLVVREWYQKNKGATYEALAKDLDIPSTTVKRHAIDLVDEFNKELKAAVVQLDSEGLSQQEIVKKLKARYPKVRISQSTISSWLKEAKEKTHDAKVKKTGDVAHRIVKVTCPPKTGPGSELVLLQNLRSIGGQDEAESFYC